MQFNEKTCGRCRRMDIKSVCRERVRAFHPSIIGGKWNFKQIQIRRKQRAKITRSNRSLRTGGRSIVKARWNSVRRCVRARIRPRFPNGRWRDGDGWIFSHATTKARYYRYIPHADGLSLSKRRVSARRSTRTRTRIAARAWCAGYAWVPRHIRTGSVFQCNVCFPYAHEIASLCNHHHGTQCARCARTNDEQ